MPEDATPQDWSETWLQARNCLTRYERAMQDKRADDAKVQARALSALAEVLKDQAEQARAADDSTHAERVVSAVPRSDERPSPGAWAPVRVVIAGEQSSVPSDWAASIAGKGL